MLIERPCVLLCFNSTVRQQYVTDADLARLEQIAEWEWLSSEGQPAVGTTGWEWGNASTDPADSERLKEAISAYDALVVCHGAPYLDAGVLDARSACATPRPTTAG